VHKDLTQDGLSGNKQDRRDKPTDKGDFPFDDGLGQYLEDEGEPNADHDQGKHLAKDAHSHDGGTGPYQLQIVTRNRETGVHENRQQPQTSGTDDQDGGSAPFPAEEPKVPLRLAPDVPYLVNGL